MYIVIRQNLPDMTEKLLIGKINRNLINKQTIRFYFHFYNKPVHSDKLVRVTTLVEPVRILGSPNPKKWLSFGFVGIFEYIILPMLIIFLGMCPNSYGWMPGL